MRQRRFATWFFFYCEHVRKYSDIKIKEGKTVDKWDKRFRLDCLLKSYLFSTGELKPIE
jgi:hypothetical protein